ncbi:MAG: COX15/CtaA family protein, partial [Burkholderiaceae bacterium]
MSIDLSPTLLLLLKAAAIAAVPLAVVGFSRSSDKYRRLAWLTAFLTFDLIVFGAFTRLTDSGLGCPDWPGCYGHSNPLSAGEPIRAAETALPSGPVTMTKAWIEMVHRYFAMSVGALIVVLAAIAWRRWWRDRTPSPWLASAVLLAVCLQGAFGAFTVTMKLQPAIVSLHLLGGMGLLALLVWLALRESSPVAVAAAATRLRWLAAASLIVVFCQVALGGWVSSNYAVLACTDFPLCQGEWLPAADFSRGFTLWRSLGRDAAGELIPFGALVAIHWV